MLDDVAIYFAALTRVSGSRMLLIAPSTEVNPNKPKRIHPAGELLNMKFIIAPVRIIKLFKNITISVLSISKSNKKGAYSSNKTRVYVAQTSFRTLFVNNRGQNVGSTPELLSLQFVQVVPALPLRT